MSEAPRMSSLPAVATLDLGSHGGYRLIAVVPDSSRQYGEWVVTGLHPESGRTVTWLVETTQDGLNFWAGRYFDSSDPDMNLEIALGSMMNRAGVRP